MAEKWNREMRLQRDDFIREIMIGNCPKCGSPNIHDCSAPEFVPDIEGKPMKIGSECPVARMLDDPCIGHCDDCGYLWCLECCSGLSIENPNCEHWKICEKCDVEEVISEMDEEELSNLWISIEDCINKGICPYEGQIFECPKIKKGRK